MSDFVSVKRRQGDFCLFSRKIKVVVADTDGNAVGFKSVFAQPHSDHIAQKPQNLLCGLIFANIHDGGRAMSDGFDGQSDVAIRNGAVVVACGAVFYFYAVDAKNVFKHFFVGFGKVAYCVDIIFCQFFLSLPSYHEHIRCGQPPHDAFVVVFVDDGSCVGFFKVAAEFCKHFAKGHADRNGKSRTLFYFFPQFVGYFFAVAKQF